MLYSELQKLCAKISSGDGGVEYVVPESVFKLILRAAVASIEVDEAWYLKRYPDVEAAIKEGRISNGREHYLTSGYFENRQPRQFEVDELFYLKSNPDVKSAVETGDFERAQSHFEAAGFSECRKPCADFSLLGRL